MDDYYSDNQPELIHCPNCGEDYAATYRSCPFCNAANASRPGGRSGSSRSNSSRSGSSGRSNSSSGRSGSRVHTNTRGGGYGGPRSPLNIIGIVIAVVLIVAFVIVVFSLVRSMLTGGRNKNNDVSEGSGVVSTVPDEEQEEEDESEPSEMVITPDGLRLSEDTLTLTADEESVTLTATPDPEGWVGQIIWSSNDGSVATVNQAGVVSYVGDGTCTITASAAGVIATCEVTCTSGGEAGTSDGGEASSGEGSSETAESSGTSTSLVIKAYGNTMGSDVTIRVGESVPFVGEGGNGTYTWSIEDSSIASVDSSTGTCVGLSAGVTYLTLSSGGESLSLKVIVR